MFNYKEDDDMGDNPSTNYATPTTPNETTRKVAWSSNVHRFSDRGKNHSSLGEETSMPHQQPQQRASILRRDRGLGSGSIQNRSSLDEDTILTSTSGGGGDDRRWSDGSRFSLGSAGISGHTRGSIGSGRGPAANGPPPGGGGEMAGGGAANSASGRRNSLCLPGGFCGMCQNCICCKQRQQQAPPQQQQMQRATGGNGLLRNTSQTNAIPPPRQNGIQQKMLRCLCCFPKYLASCITNPSKRSLFYMQSIARSRIWTAIILFFTLVALFGPYIQDLAIPKEGDTACDVMYTLTFALFLMDVIIRCYVTPNYWTWNVNLWFLCFCFLGCAKRKREGDGTGGSESGSSKNGSGGRLKKKSSGSSGGPAGTRKSNDTTDENVSLAALWRSFSLRIGSFMFWCDLVSTATLCYEVSYINGELREVKTADILLGEYNQPVSGIEGSHQPFGPELQFSLIVAIARTARIARFIRASVVVKTSSKVNWYWLPDHISPHYWYNRCFGRIFNRKKSRMIDDRDDSSVNSSTRRMNNTGGKESGRRPSFISRSRAGSIGRANSLDDGIPGSNSPASTNISTKKAGVLQRLMVSFRGPDKETQKQIDAAIKIQRAFRISRDPTYEGGYYAEKSGRRSSSIQSYSKKSSFADQVKKSIRKSPSKSSKSRVDSHVGSAMRELTGQRVALGIMISLIFTALLTYWEIDTTDATTMNVLHNQTQNSQFADASLDVAHKTSVPEMFKYQFVDGTVRYFEISGRQPDELRNREIRHITVTGSDGSETQGWFSQRNLVRDNAIVQLVSTFFIMVVWFLGVTAFAGPVMILVVTPIERMIRLLSMLMRDPLGYQNTPRYKKFESEDEEFLRNTKWTKKVLEGMETSFLMSTILRIGNLMKVGFGSAGVEIIRNNLMHERGKRLNLNMQGSTVSCIFLFCDIRQFTDATECLQEEVFVFTNKIAAVVHSICHSYGGSANKNVGDAFLVSWLLDDSRSMNAPNDRDNSFVEPFSTGGSLLHRRASNEHPYSTPNGYDDELHANNHQADKALLSVIKICIALHHDDFYTEDMSDAAKERLMDKLKKREGPVVQMGFGLHAGKAVQGAIGSQRKLDATYISESVELSEFLESSTKKYGVKMLMSGDFYKLLHPNQKRRCRKIDQLLIHSDDDEASETGEIDEDDVMELHTFDMDIDSLWKTTHNHNRGDPMESASDSEASVRPTMTPGDKRSRRNVMEGKSMHDRKSFGRRVSMMAMGLAANHQSREDFLDGHNRSGKDMGMTGSTSGTQGAGAGGTGGTPSSPSEGDNENGKGRRVPKLILPTGPVPYNASVWLSDEMKEIRKRYSGGIFFPKFNAGLQSFYARDWEHARQCFQTILERFDDGPSQYFLNIIEENNGIPPRNFNGYGTA